MNDEELKYYTALQPFFRKKMGLIRTHDTMYCLKYDWVKVALDCAYADEGCSEDSNCKDRLRLPLPIDPVNPERGLWGMVDWELFSSLSPNPASGEWYIFGMTDRRAKGFSSEWQTPTLALLKALAEQEGVEIK